jgi:ribonuclease HI
MLIKGGNITIEELIREEDCYGQFRRSLRKRQLLFLEQLASFDGKRLVHWQEIKGSVRKGPKPGWFKLVERKLLARETGKDIPEYIYKQMVERFNTCNWNIDKTSKDVKWVAIQNPAGIQPIMGKKKKTLNENEFTIAHYICEESSGGVVQSPLKKCKGCVYNNKNLTGGYKNSEICLIQTGVACSVDVNVIKSQVSLRSTPDRSSKLRLRSEPGAIIDGLKIIKDNLQEKTNNDNNNNNNINTTRLMPLIIIDNSGINRVQLNSRYEKFWSNNDIQNELDVIRKSLADCKKVDIYTDGSLSEDNNQQEKIVMGCGWVAIKEDNSKLTFRGQVENFVSSTRAELMAILTAVYATPRDTKLNIYTDSQASIEAISNAVKNSKKVQKKFKNWTLLQSINEIIAVQNIEFNMFKVKAHSGIEYNEMADKLAKDGISYHICDPNVQSLASVNAIGYWKTNQIEVPFREFTKKLGTAKRTANWRLLNRNLNSISDYKSQQISWEITWKTISLSYRERLATSDKETRERAFNMKLLNNELPTLERMYDRFPSVYKDNICVRCNEFTESHIHVFACTKNLVDIDMCRNKLIETLVDQINIVASNASGKNIREKLNSLQEIAIAGEGNIRDPNELSFHDILFGLIPTALYELIHSITGKKGKTI